MSMVSGRSTYPVRPRSLALLRTHRPAHFRRLVHSVVVVINVESLGVLSFRQAFGRKANVIGRQVTYHRLFQFSNGLGIELILVIHCWCRTLMKSCKEMERSLAIDKEGAFQFL